MLRVALLCWLVATLGTGAADAPFLTTTNEVPAGFADLLEPQTTQADVYFNGEFLLSSFVTYDLESVELLVPDEITDAIPTLINPDVVRAALAGKLDTNASVLCNRRTQQHCGALTPDVAAVMFDESRFRLDLFVNPNQQAIASPVAQRYLPPSQATLALLHDVSLTAAGRAGDDNYSLFSESFLSRGSTRLRSRYGFTSRGPSIDELSAQWDEPDREYELGYFRSGASASAFINDVDMLGLRIASSTNTRVDLEQAGGNPLLIFLDRRSRVDIYRGEELLDSRFYDAGNQQLDTSRLPDGAYDLIVRIIDLDGRERLESHFFARSDFLPPKGEPRYYLELGQFTDRDRGALPQIGKRGWIRAGGARRVADAIALDAEVLLTHNTTLVQLGAYVFGSGWYAHAGLLAGSAGERGYALRGGFRREKTSLNVDFRRVLSAISDPLDTRFRVLRNDTTQASLSFAFPFGRGQAYLRGRHNQRGNATPDRSIGLSYIGPLFNYRSIAADLSFDSSLSNRQNFVRLGINLRWRGDNQYSTFQPQLQMIDEAGEQPTTDLLLDARWNRTVHSERFGDVLQGAFVHRDQERAAVGALISAQSRYGYGDLTVANNFGGGESGLSFTSNARLSLVTKNGRTALGGGGSQLAAVVVDIDGDLPDAQFKVVVDNRVAGYATTARRSVISLRPYESYDIRISPAGSALFAYDETTHRVTLYPGNVQRLQFHASEVTVLIGQALTADEQPLTFARFQNVEGYATTDAYGWYQVEVSHTHPLILATQEGTRCRLTLPAYVAEDGLAMLEPKTCKTIPEQP